MGEQSNYSPYKDDEYMSAAMLNHFKVELLDWRDSILNRDMAIKNDIELQTQNIKPDYTDRNMISRLREAEYRELEEDIIEIDNHILDEIEHALDKVDQGTYGYCEESGNPIGIRRLEIWPIARLTIEAQKKRALQDDHTI